MSSTKDLNQDLGNDLADMILPIVDKERETTVNSAFGAPYGGLSLDADKLTEAVGDVKPVSAFDILTSAAGHVKAREDVYDRAAGEKSMARAVKAFNAIHGTHLTTAQGWHFMAMVKSSRFFSQDTFHRDSGEDATAYMALMSEARAMEV